ncbi:MAG: class I SAM-dependent methyltransferase [Calditrichaeota bacterium]|nr:class I SAM-dependent methyltransferase [Calditrichota bacterium]
MGLFDRAYGLARGWTTRWKKRLVGRLIQPGRRILDVGCGTGEFLAALSGDYEVFGLEPDPDAARWARAQYHLDVRAGHLEPEVYPPDCFDLITFWHALEHIPDPLGALALARQLLKETGYLLIAVPNCSALDARLYGRHWVAYDAPRHLWHFTPDTLPALAARASFHLLRSRMLPLDLFYNALWSERISIAEKGFAALPGAVLRLPLGVPAAFLHGLVTGRYSGMLYLFGM